MKRLLSQCALFTVLVCPAAAWAQAQPVEPLEPAPAASMEPVEDGVSTWFVELQGKPKSKGGSAASLSQEKQAFRAAAQEAGVTFQERYSYDGLWNGVSVRVSEVGLAKLSRLPEVKNLYPVVDIAVPEPEPGEGADLVTALAQTQANIAQSGLGLTGQGVIVAIMDTGVDYDHPDLGGCFGPGCRVEAGFDLVGDAYDSSTNPVQVPDPFPDDCNGHGSHVAGIVGANGGIKGVAPGVKLHAYRVFGCGGTTSADVMVAAMEMVLAGGADVLNMSIGAAFQWPQYPTAVASDNLVDAGVVVVTSAGNNGANGMYATGAPGVGGKVIATANFQNTHINFPAFTVSADNSAVAYNAAAGAPLTPVLGTYPLARTGTTASLDDACNAVAPPLGSLTGKIALIRRFGCPFNEKVANAQNAGAIGVVLYNNIPGALNPNAAGAVPVTVPVVGISDTDGALINGRIAAGATTLTWTPNSVSIPNPLANRISASSSWGVAPDLTLKPDIGAPGGNIRSTIPVEIGSYGLLSGTSMASPHVAGAVALLLEAHPGMTPAAVQALLQNYAVPQLWTGNPALGFLDMTHRQGGGMLRIADAINATVSVQPGELALGESQAGPATRTLTVHNSGSSPVTLDLSHTPALATNGTFTISSFNAPATVTWSAPTLTVPAGGTASVNATITVNAGLLDKSLYGGYLVLTPQGGGRAVRVPYVGFKGDYQSIQVLVPTVNGFPWLAKLDSGGNLVNQPAGATYTLQGDDVPFFVVHFDHQVQHLEMKILEAGSGNPVHPVFHFALKDDYLPRNSGAATFFAFTWDGTRLHSNGNKNKTKEVPDGQYLIVLRVLKALGDANNPAHWESWTSPVITLDRP